MRSDFSFNNPDDGSYEHSALMSEVVVLRCTRKIKI